MTRSTLIPWTPRTIPNEPKPENPQTLICERTLDLLQPVFLEALRPFPEARRALRTALLEFDDRLHGRNTPNSNRQK